MTLIVSRKASFKCVLDPLWTEVILGWGGFCEVKINGGKIGFTDLILNFSFEAKPPKLKKLLKST